MISKDKITEIFCIADDFCKELEKEFAKKVLPDSDNAPKRHRKRMMSDAEVITILICFHFNSYRNFKHYYGCFSALYFLEYYLELALVGFSVSSAGYSCLTHCTH